MVENIRKVVNTFLPHTHNQGVCRVAFGHGRVALTKGKDRNGCNGDTTELRVNHKCTGVDVIITPVSG